MTVQIIPDVRICLAGVINYDPISGDPIPNHIRTDVYVLPSEYQKHSYRVEGYILYGELRLAVHAFARKDGKPQKRWFVS